MFISLKKKIFGIFIILCFFQINSFTQEELSFSNFGLSGYISNNKTEQLHSFINGDIGAVSETDNGFRIHSGYMGFSYIFDDSTGGNGIISGNTNIELYEDSSLTLRFNKAKEAEISIVNYPENGLLKFNNSEFTYTPNGNYFGNDLFTYYITTGETDSNVFAVIINILPVNDTPKLNASFAFKAIEETDVILNYKDLYSISGARDADNDDLIFIVTSIFKGAIKTLAFEDIIVGQTKIDKASGIIWSPPTNLSGTHNVFKLKVTDRNSFSSEAIVRSNVSDIPDKPKLVKPFAGVEIKQGGDLLRIDLAKNFYDPDLESKKYFIQEIDDEFLVSGAIIDSSVLLLTSSIDNFGTTKVTIGFESGGEIIYGDFNVDVKEVTNVFPHKIRNYWRGKSNEFGNVDLREPFKFWSFESISSIYKTSKNNWAFDGEDNSYYDITDTSNIHLDNGDWINIYFDDGNSIRIQNNNFIKFKLSDNDFSNLLNYTLVIDIKSKFGFTNPILNTVQKDSSAVSEFRITSGGEVGGQSNYSNLGTIKPNLWYRLIYVVDIQNKIRRYFVDDELSHTQIISNQAEQSRHKLNLNEFRIGDDVNSRSNNYEIKKIVLYNYSLSSQQAQYLGFNGYEELGDQQSKGELEQGNFLHLIKPNDNDPQSDDEYGLMLYSKEKGSAIWQIQQSDNLTEWKRIGEIEIISNDERGNLGYFTIPNLTTLRNNLFYRALLIN